MHDPTEAKTRRELIDPALEKAGWKVDDSSQVGIEIPVDGFPPEAWDELKTRLRKIGESGVPFDVKLPEGICDYTLYRENGDILAVVEAKRTSIDPRLAQAQTQFYVEQIESYHIKISAPLDS